MDILRDLIESLRYKDTSDVYVPHSSVFYTRAAIEQKLGIRMDVLEVERLLIEEGLMPKTTRNSRYSRVRK